MCEQNLCGSPAKWRAIFAKIGGARCERAGIVAQFENSRLMTTLPKRSAKCAWLFLAAICWAALPVFAAGAAAHAPLVAGKIFQWRPFLAPFHAVVLHFPIGFVTMAFVLEIYRRRRQSAELKPVTALTLWLSLLGGVLAAGLGILRAADGGYETHAVESHRWTGLAVVGCTLATLVVQRLAYRDELRRGWTYCYRGLLTVTFGLLVVAGHIGGNLTHGSKYLTENAPTFVRELLEETPATTEATAATGLDDAQSFFAEQVQPILEHKCVRCHGAEKQKGDYRLDQPEVALKGGESGKAAIKPGDPLGSELVRLVLLPAGDDDIMPPEGKEPLTADEVLTVIRWIQKGAAFPPATVEESAR